MRGIGGGLVNIKFPIVQIHQPHIAGLNVFGRVGLAVNFHAHCVKYIRQRWTDIGDGAGSKAFKRRAGICHPSRSREILPARVVMLSVVNVHADVAHGNARMILQQGLLQKFWEDDARRVVVVHSQRQQVGLAVNVVSHPRKRAAVIGWHFIPQIQSFGNLMVLQPRKNMHPICADVGRNPRIVHRDHGVGGVKLSGLAETAMHLKLEHIAQTGIQNFQTASRWELIHGGNTSLS